ncbi:hypothetical protein [Stenotrophomonas maltophilia]|uniref:Uncharacterized protein n=1 Tax=Stenotrophomonas maltophilia TaxID=40324 RepID=A0A4S2D362_STEMA|nr:hypothetical protein [Stenotrophomonas maltophilia]TGY35967.1 hypothetical protein E5352_04985 [Stenotrophomonas maltophilia]
MIGRLFERLMGASLPTLQEGRPGTALLQALGSGDYGRLRTATATVALTRDAGVLDDLVAQLPYVEAARARYTTDPRWIREHYELDFVLRKLRYWRDGSGCLCQLYPHWMHYQPGREVASGHVLPLATGVADGGWGDTLDATCTVCGRGWRCTDREYHAPWWEWTPRPPA